MKKIRALIHTWLLLDFFGDARRSGGAGSTLTTTIFVQSFLAFAFAFLMFPEKPPVPFAAANLCLSSLLVSIGALANDHGWGRRRADEALLGCAPVRPHVVLIARAGHSAFYVCLVTIGMALPPGILLAFLRADWTQLPLYVALACACSGLASGALGLAVRLLERAFGPARAALLAGTGKALLLGGGLVLFALGLQRLSGTADDLPIGRLGAELLPPYQAARWLAEPRAEAWRLLPFVAGVPLLWLIGAVLGTREGASRAKVGRHSPLRWLLQRLAGRGPRRGIAEFTAASMWRNPGFRARVLPLLGLPAGMVFLALQKRTTESRHDFTFTCLLLQLPAIYLPFLIAFLPRAEQGEARWIFDQAPGLTMQVVRDAARRALVTHVLVPVLAVALVFLLVASPTRAAAAAAVVFSLGTAILASRVMVRALAEVPFTRDRDSDAAADLGGLFAFALVLGGAGTLFGGLLPAGWQWPVALTTLVLAGLDLRRGPDAGAMPLPGSAEARGERDTPAEAVPPNEDVAAATRSGSLRPELRAVTVLYAAVCILPCLVGLMFG